MINFLKFILDIKGIFIFFIKVSIISLLNVFIKIITYMSLSIGKKINHLPYRHIYMYNSIYNAFKS